MGLLDKWRGKAANSAPVPQPPSSILSVLTAGTYPTTAVSQPSDFATLMKSGYESNAYAHTAIMLLAEGVAEIPFVVATTTARGAAKRKMERALYNTKGKAQSAAQRFTKTGEMVEVAPTHPLVQLLDKPNPRQDGATLIRDYVAWLQGTGNTYLEKARTAPNKPPAALYVWRSDCTRVTGGDSVEVSAGFEYQFNGLTKWLSSRDVIHWKTFGSTNNLYGMPPLLAAAKAVDTTNTAQAWQIQTLRNSAKPSGILHVSPPADGTGGKKFDQWLTKVREWMGFSNAGKPLVLEAMPGGDVKWIPTSFTALELDWLKGIRLSAAQIAMVYRVPSILLGDTESSTYSNMEEARKGLYQDAIFPLAVRLAKVLQRQLASEFGDDLLIYPDFDSIAATQDDTGKKATWVGDLFVKNIITQNQALTALGFETVPGGDVYSYQLAPKGAAMAKHLALYGDGPHV